MFLLAQFREVRAYPVVIRFASLSSDILDALCGQFLTGDLNRVLSSVCGGELNGIQSLIENESVDEWVRGAAVNSMVTLVVTGQRTREEILGYFETLFRGKLARRPGNVWDELVSCCAALCAADLIGDIEQAYLDDVADPGFISLEEVRRDAALGVDQALERLSEDPHHSLVEDTVQEMEWWDCYQAEEPEPYVAPSPKPYLADPGRQVPPPPAAPSSTPQTRSQPKTGRNEPCPCGSGKKYKKCCGA